MAYLYFTQNNSNNGDTVVNNVNTVQNNTTATSSSGSSSSSSSSHHSSSSGSSVVSEQTVNINGNDYNRVYYSDGSYKTYGTVSGKLYQNTHDSEPIDQQPYDYKI